MGLLQADLLSLRNLPATSAGRRLLFATLFGLGLLAVMWWSVSCALLQHQELLPYLHDRTGGDSLRTFLGMALMPCPVAATWLGLSTAQRQLFETPELLLWRQAPMPGWRGPVQVLLRASFATLVWASALTVPFLATLLLRAAAPPLAWLLVPLALVCCTLPLLCTVLALQIVLVRFFSGPLLRLVLAGLAALASVGFSAWLLISLFTPAGAHLRDAAAGTGLGTRLPFTVSAATDLLHAAALGTLDTQALRTSLGWLGLTTAAFWFAARLHPRAVERHLESAPPLLRRRRSAWPASLSGVIRRKEFAQVLQQPGALIGFLVFAVLVFALVRERVLVGGLLDNRRLPASLGHLTAMLVQWFLAVLLVLYAHMGRLAMWDGAQWSLYMTAPAAPRAILRGKLEAVALFLLWPLVLVGTFGSALLGITTTTLLVFVGVALAGTLAALGVLAIVGTWPRLMRPDEGGQIVQGGRSFLAAMVLVLLFELVLSPTWPAWQWLAANVRTEADVRGKGPWIVAAAWVWGVVVAAVGVAIGARNFRRLSTAR